MLSKISKNLKNMLLSEPKYVYNKNIPVVSDFVGELFHVSDSRKNGTTAGAVGAVDETAKLVVEPLEVAENINNVVRRPGKTALGVFFKVKNFFESKRSSEENSRIAGRVIYEIVLLLMGVGVLKLGANVGKVVEVEKAGEAARSINWGAKARNGEDLAKGFQNILKGKGENSELMLKVPDNVGDTKHFSQLYKNLFEEGGVSKSEGGVRINKANGLVDEVSNAAGKVERGPGVIESGTNTASTFQSLSRDDARDMVSNLLDNGEISINDLEKLVPENTPNTFVPTATMKDGAKYEFILADGQKVIIRWHEPDPVAASKFPGCTSGSRYTAEIKVGNKQLKVDGGWSRNQSTNDVHVPIKGK